MPSMHYRLLHQQLKMNYKYTGIPSAVCADVKNPFSAKIVNF